MKRVIAMVITLGLAFTLFAFNVNAASTTYPWYYTSRSNTKAVDYTSVFVSAYQFSPYNGEVAYNYSANSTDVVIQSEILFVTVQIRNFGTSTKYINGLTINLLSNAETGLMAQYQNEILDVDYIIRDFYVMPAGANDGSFTFYPSAEWGYNGAICIPVNTTLVCQFKIKLPTWNVTPNNFSNFNSQLYTVSIGDYRAYDVDFTPNGSHEDVIDHLVTIEEMLQAMYESQNSSDYNDTITESNDLQTTEDTIHQQEQQWYSDNKTAIEATGLGNYQYSPGLINSFGVARYQIAMLWNALGDWTYVYYLVFLLGLAVYILRHEPTMRVKQMRADREARMQESQIYTNASRNVRMSRDADYARHVAWGFRSRRK